MASSLLAASDLRLLDRFWREPVERSVLPNGATVLLKPDRSAALASVQVWVKTGSIHEGRAARRRLSHYLEHMLFKGTGRRAGREISATVQAHGGYINAYTTFDRTVYYIDLPSEHAAVAIDLLADAVLHSTLPADEVAKEKDVILREIAMTQDDPDDRLWRSLFVDGVPRASVPPSGHRPPRRVLGGQARGSGRVLPEPLRAEQPRRRRGRRHRRRRRPRAAVEAHFGAAPRARLAPVLVPDEPGAARRRARSTASRTSSSRGPPSPGSIPGLAHRDAAGARPARDGARPRRQLDPVAGAAGEGGARARDRRLLLESGDERALLRLVHLRGGQARARDGGARGRPAALGGPRLPAGHLRKALRQLVAGEIAARQTMSGQAARLGEAEVVVGDLDYRRSYFERLGAVEAADLGRALRTYLVPAGRTSVSISPAGSRGASGSPAPAAASAKAESLSETRLPNGARLLLQREPRLPNLHVRLLMAGGSAYEPAGRRGITALLANLLTKDTRSRSAAEVARLIEEVGGSFYPFFGNASLGLSVEVLPPDAGLAIELLSEAVLAARLPGPDPQGRARSPAGLVGRGRRRCRDRGAEAPAPKILRERIRWRSTPRATRQASRRWSRPISPRCTGGSRSRRTSSFRSPATFRAGSRRGCGRSSPRCRSGLSGRRPRR